MEENYFSKVEQHFGARRGSLFIMSPKDFALVEIWHDAGIPLEAVLRGIDKTFEHRASTQSFSAVNSIKYCEQEVLKECVRMKEARVGAQ